MGMIDRLRTYLGGSPSSARDRDGWEFLNFGGMSYPLGMPLTTWGQPEREEIGRDYLGLVAGAYAGNSVIFACMMVRQLLFTEIRFQFRRNVKGRPGELFGTPALDLLEHPWPGGTTGDLLKLVITDADLAGNGFVVRRPNRLRRIRPDWTTLVYGSQHADPGIWDIDAELIGLLYHPGGHGSGRQPEVLLPEEFAHYAPIPDPTSPYAGMSWLTPVIREIMADSAATSHKLRFFENAATPNLLVKLPPQVTDPVKFKEWVAAIEQTHKGSTNAYKSLYLGAGSDATVIGTNLQQLDFKAVQGAGETRIAAAAGVPPVIVGLSEGLQGSSLNAGNYESAMRRFVDLEMSPLWRNLAGSLERIIDVPAGANLWFDARDVPALKGNVADAATVQSAQAQSIRTLVDGGFTAESVIDAIVSGDLKRLDHSGLLSVQLVPPQPDGPPTPGPGAIPDQLKPFVAPTTDTKPADGKTPAPTKAGRAAVLATILERSGVRP